MSVAPRKRSAPGGLPPPPPGGQRVALGQPRPPCIAQGARRPPRACTRVAARRSSCHPARYRRPAHSSPAVQATPPLARSRCQVWAHVFRFAPAMPRHGPRPPTLRAAPGGARSPALVECVAVTLGVGAGGVVPSAGGVAMGGDVVGLGVAEGGARCALHRRKTVGTAHTCPCRGGLGVWGSKATPSPPAQRIFSARRQGFAPAGPSCAGP